MVDQLFRSLEREIDGGMARMPLLRLRKLLLNNDEITPEIYKQLGNLIESVHAHCDFECQVMAHELCTKILGQLFTYQQLFQLAKGQLRYVSLNIVECPCETEMNLILLESVRRKGIQNPIICRSQRSSKLITVLHGKARVTVCRILGIERIAAYVFPPDTEFGF